MVPNYVDEIKARVSMYEIAETYGYEMDKRHKILCPFHGDRKPSMQLYPGDRGYYCFSCGEGGDVIDFVGKTCGMTFQDACKKIDLDFRLGLNIGEDLDPKAKKAAEREARERKRKQAELRKKRELAQAIYEAAYNRFSFLDILKRDYAPKSPEEPIRQEYMYACRNIDAAWQEVTETAEKLRALEEGR